jgi:hypothetical protein
MMLANDQPDRSHERFDLGYLGRFSETIQGKSVLVGHDYGSVPVGKFFDSEIIKAENEWQWVAPWFYMPISPGNQLDRDNIDSGVWSYVSIGASVDYAGLVCDICGQAYYPWLSNDASAPECPHVLGRSYDGRVATATWTTSRSDMIKVEAVEGSIVYLGCQYDAAIAKSVEQSDELQKRKLECISDEAIQLSNTPPSRRDQGGSSLEELLKALGVESAEAAITKFNELKEQIKSLGSLAEVGKKLTDSIRAEIKAHLAFLEQPEAIQNAYDHIDDVEELIKTRDELAKTRAEKAAGSHKANGEGSGDDDGGADTTSNGDGQASTASMPIGRSFDVI